MQISVDYQALAHHFDSLGVDAIVLMGSHARGDQSQRQAIQPDQEQPGEKKTQVHSAQRQAEDEIRQQQEQDQPQKGTRNG